MPEYHPGEPFGLVGPRGELILDEASARVLNEVRAELKRLGHLTGVSPVSVSDDGAGRRISLDLPPTFPAKLSGTGNPYGYVEQVPVAGGTWADRAGGRTGSDAYEVNAFAGLAGKVVNLRISDAGDWRFQWVRKGTVTCGNVTINVQGCWSKQFAGAGYTLTLGGATVASGIIGSTGFVRVPISTTGTYTASVTPPSGASWWNPAAVTGTANVTNCATGGSINLTLVPATGFACICTQCRDPQSNQPMLTDVNGTYQMTWNAGSGSWNCCYTLPQATLYSGCSPDTAGGAGSMAVGYRLGCPGPGGPYVLKQVFTACNFSPPFNPVAGTCSGDFAADTAFGGFKTFTTQAFNATSPASSPPNNCLDSLSFSLSQDFGAYLAGTVGVTFL